MKIATTASGISSSMTLNSAGWLRNVLYKTALLLICLLSSTINSAMAADAPIRQWQDTDVDGVPDRKDACAKTVANQRVDASGCSHEQQALRLTPSLAVMPNYCFNTSNGQLFPSSCSEMSSIAVRFEFAKAQVLMSQQQVFVGLSRWLNATNVPLVLIGHTDSIGEARFNQHLSVERAQQVKKVLVQQFGFAADRFQVKGMGSVYPAASNQTAYGREKNRRVEFLVNVQ
ncbi:OmpA family protein [Shewanella sp. 1CM18E]|uniref:OmpA family protein n=1 Tax=Shewanella sp. 1CM18E TaxID=2929169 RepID=UPI0020BFE5BE|nr:OmpA family protein [Shewanella sp. 1CM18E]MCK8043567.1 OmpA family protein [Shewanella sp. 1CM18E]